MTQTAIGHKSSILSAGGGRATIGFAATSSFGRNLTAAP